MQQRHRELIAELIQQADDAATGYATECARFMSAASFNGKITCSIPVSDGNTTTMTTSLLQMERGDLVLSWSNVLYICVA